MADQFLGHRAVGEGRPAGQQEIEGGPQAVDVGADVHGMAVDRLFRGEVVGGAEDVPLVVLLGEAVVGVVEEAGQAHVEDLDDALAVQQQVGGLDVAVDQAGLVGVVQAEGGLADVVGGARHVHRPAALDDVLQAGRRRRTP